MKKLLLWVILSGLLLVVVGCGGGGSGESITPVAAVSLSTSSAQTIGISLTATNSDGDVITTTIDSITVKSSTLTVACNWKIVKKNSKKETVNKLSDAGTTYFYIVDNNSTKHFHTAGTGAAYTTTALSTDTAVTGTYTFSASLSSGNYIYFYNSYYGVKSGWISVSQ